MPFRFTLAGPLRLRQMQERQQQMALYELLRQAAQLQEQAAKLAQCQLRAKAECSDQMRRGVTGIEVQFAQFCVRTMEARQQQLVQRQSDLDTKISLQRAALAEARQARQVIEKVRDRQFDLYRREQEHKSQRRLDDLFLLIRQFSQSR
jgi:flagellar export protein FliJ